ncbi:MAG: AbgT family transporter [Xanthomonadaceae bacterium]|nr:AbgT family transporter [Xanthomonadaceae bacterium]
MSEQNHAPDGTAKRWLDRALNSIEVVGNKLPDPAALFLILLVVVWLLSWWMSGMSFAEIDPRTGNPIEVQNQLAGASMATFLSRMVSIFVNFAPLGVVLVALLGVGVAEHTGLINAGLRWMLGFTSKALLTPMVVAVGIISHTAVDAGYVLVIPIGAVIFYAAGRHPLAGIAAAFAGVSGGFSANFVPSAIDPLLQSFTQEAGRIINPELLVNPLVNYYFTAMSSVLIIGLGWYLTDKIVEPRLRRNTPVDGDMRDMPTMEPLAADEKRGLMWAGGAVALGLGLLFASLWPETSPMRAADGQLSSFQAPIMQSIVPLIFLLFLIPGVVYGYVAKTIKGHRDVIEGMSKSMSTMGYYIVMAFFAAQFIYAFGNSNLGALLALKGAGLLTGDDGQLLFPPQVTIVGIILLTGFVNLFVGSASAKWALLAPIFVPMLMLLEIHPGLTQAAYRVGDSTTNIITPLMPYFPLVVVFCRKYVKGTGIGTLVSMMLPYSVVFITVWTVFLLLYWALGIPLGLQASYTYP